MGVAKIVLPSSFVVYFWVSLISDRNPSPFIAVTDKLYIVTASKSDIVTLVSVVLFEYIRVESLVLVSFTSYVGAP